VCVVLVGRGMWAACVCVVLVGRGMWAASDDEQNSRAFEPEGCHTRFCSRIHAASQYFACIDDLVVDCACAGLNGVAVLPCAYFTYNIHYALQLCAGYTYNNVVYSGVTNNHGTVSLYNGGSVSGAWSGNPAHTGFPG
jgi:hypothetical protein